MIGTVWRYTTDCLTGARRWREYTRWGKPEVSHAAVDCARVPGALPAGPIAPGAIAAPPVPVVGDVAGGAGPGFASGAFGGFGGMSIPGLIGRSIVAGAIGGGIVVGAGELPGWVASPAPIIGTAPPQPAPASPVTPPTLTIIAPAAPISPASPPQPTAQQPMLPPGQSTVLIPPPQSTVDVPPAPIPEPSSWALLGGAALIIIGARCKWP